MTAPLRWSLAWSWGGESGTVADVQVTLTERAGLFGSEPGIRKAVVECVIDIDVAAMANRTHPRSGLATLYANGLIVIDGSWTSFSYDPTGSSSGRTRVSIALGDSDADDRGEFPPSVVWSPAPGSLYVSRLQRATWAEQKAAIEDAYDSYGILSPIDTTVEAFLTEESFGDAPTITKGQSWPWVYGAPGNGSLVFAGSPAWITYVNVGDPEILMVAGHAVTASTVTILGPPSTGSDDLVAETGVPVLTTTTPSGRVYSYVEVDPVGTPWSNVVSDLTKRYYVAWDDGEAQPGGAGDVLATIYALSSNRVDVQAWRAAAPTLNRYTLAGYVDRTSSPSEYARNVLLPMLPVSVIPGGFGHRPGIWPWLEAGTAPSGPRVVAGQGVVADGAVEYRSLVSEIRRLVVRYGRRADTDGLIGAASAGRGSSAYGAQPGPLASSETWEADCVWSAGTASALAELHYRTQSWAPRIRALMVTDWTRYGPGGDAELYPGREVRYTDPACGWTDRAAVVVEVESSATSRRVTLWLRDDPLTDVA